MTRQWGNPEVSDEAFWDAQLLRLLTLESSRILERNIKFTDFNTEYDASFAAQQDRARTAINAALDMSPL